MIILDTVSFSRGTTPVLASISATLPSGGLIALIGPNGAGKSTLMALMARLLPLQQGAIRFDDDDVATTPTAELARRVSILKQDAAVEMRLSVRDLVGFGRYPYHHGRPTAHDNALRDEALERFDLMPLADRFVDTLSGGQRQRAFIAMAYCQATPYLLLDEPLNNLDMAHARQIMRILRSLCMQDRRTIVVVMHDINYAATYADHIVALKDGCLVASAPTAEVMRSGTLTSLFGYEFPTLSHDGKTFAIHY